MPAAGQSTVSFNTPFNFFQTEVIDSADIFDAIVKTMPITIFFDGPLPTRYFTDPSDPFSGYDYIEGPVNATRIVLGTLPPAIPVPAALPMLAGGLALLGLFSRRRTG
ncbi:MAG: hypothetical protein ACK5IB_07165 [Qingshengfaniella sp.]